ncbi:Shootin-1 [Platysternon megacephalum]|uniref:Shootin-1 n=1 Tax=Platysternon megacephalum TaxID=55544 RepID=A0A4D9E893_9SAUR|nr:Shootin-1 [Platysternon megacephalum]
MIMFHRKKYQPPRIGHAPRGSAGPLEALSLPPNAISIFYIHKPNNIPTHTNTLVQNSMLNKISGIWGVMLHQDPHDLLGALSNCLVCVCLAPLLHAPHPHYLSSKISTSSTPNLSDQWQPFTCLYPNKPGLIPLTSFQLLLLPARSQH